MPEERNFCHECGLFWSRSGKCHQSHKAVVTTGYYWPCPSISFFYDSNVFIADVKMIFYAMNYRNVTTIF
jgi:hypothetical protein